MRTRTIFFLSMLILLFICFDHGAKAHAEIMTPACEWIAIGKEESWTETTISFVDCGIPAKKLYGIRITAQFSGEVSGDAWLCTESLGWTDYQWSGNKGANEGLIFEKTELPGVYTLTLLRSTPLYSDKDNFGGFTLVQRTGSDIWFSEIDLLDSKGNVQASCGTTKLTESELVMFKGQDPVEILLLNPKGTIKWSSSDKKVATVKKGKITPISVGTTVITAKCNGKKYKCNVTVYEIGLKHSSVSMTKGSTYTAEVNGTKAIKFTSSSSKVASVNKTTGLVTAKKPGSATIKVKCENGKTYKLKVQVFDLKSLSGPKSTDIPSPGENGELVLLYDYPDGISIEKFDFQAAVDVDSFDRFSSDIKLTFDVDVDANEDVYPELGIMTAWESSGFYVDLEKYGVNDLYRYRGENHKIEIELSKDDVEKIEKAGVLTICGTGFRLNSITLTGEADNEYVRPIAPKDSPVSVHGQLKVSGGGFVDEHGDPVRLLGTTSGCDVEYLQLYSHNTLAYYRDEWGINCIRVSVLPTNPYDQTGYTDENAHRKMSDFYTDKKIDNCIDTGIYAVIGYHNYYNPLDSLDGAIEYFTRIAKKYGDCPNILYELGNEPDFGEWQHTKEYAAKLIPIIRKYAPKAVIVCPSDGWGGSIIDPYNDPLPFDNVIYVFHLYTCPFVQYQYDDMKTVLEAEFPVFLTEYSVCHTVYNEIDCESDKVWDELLNKYGVSYIYHRVSMNFTDNDYSYSCGLKPSASTNCNWAETDMGDAMKYFYHKIRRDSGLE